MNVKTTFVLLALLAGLLVVILLADKPEDTPADEGMLFAKFIAEDVRRLAFSVGGTETVLRRVPGTTDEWTVNVSGLEVPATSAEVDEILSKISRCDVVRRIPGGEVDAQSRGDYGLTPETRKISIEYADRTEDAVLGLKSPMRDTVYARRGAEDDVLLVDDDLLEALAEKSPEKVRARRPLGLLVGDIGRFSVKKGGEEAISARRRAEDSAEWEATAPFSGFLDPDKLERDFLPRLVEVEASEFSADGVKDEDLAGFGLAEPRFTLTVAKRGAGPEGERTILVGSPVPEKEGLTWFMEAGRPFVYAGDLVRLLDCLEADASKWRDRNLTRLGYRPVDRIVVKWGDVAFDATRDGAEWTLETPEKTVLDERAVEAWFADVRALEAEEFVDAPDLAALGLAEPRGEVTLFPPKHKAEDGTEVAETPVVRLLLGSERQGGGIFVRRDGMETVFAAPAALPALLRQGHYRLLKKAVLGEALGSRDVVRIQRMQGSEAEDLKKEGGAWPEGILGLVVTRVAREILDLSAVRWVGKAEGREEEYGLTTDDRQEFRITLVDSDAAGTEKEYGVVVGKETEGGRFARAIREGKPEPNVFVLAATALESLRTPFREVKEPPPEDGSEKEAPPEEATPGDGGEGDR